MNVNLYISIVVGISALLYAAAALLAGTYQNPWWYGFWGSYAFANVCWLKATGAI